MVCFISEAAGCKITDTDHMTEGAGGNATLHEHTLSQSVRRKGESCALLAGSVYCCLSLGPLEW